MNANLLRAAIVSKGYTQEKLAKEIGMATSTMCLKLKKGTFDMNEAKKIIEILDISNSSEIFFDQKVT